MQHLLPIISYSVLLCCFPILLFSSSIEKVEELVGPLNTEQQAWLADHSATTRALAEIAGRPYSSEQEQADAIFDHFTSQADPILTAAQTTYEIAILKLLHPDWSLARVVFIAAWNVTKDQTHTILDVAGLVPGWGEVADGANGVFYTLEGDKTNAGFSFAAMVPFVGWTATGAKYAGKIVKTATGRAAELKYIVNSNGFINFGSSSQLTKVIGKKANHQAHHIIPWSKNDHPLIQRAADSGDFHPNMAFNGILLDKAVHSGYDQAHRAYNARFEIALNDIFYNAGGSISPNDAARALRDLAQDISNQFSLGKKLYEITF